MNASEMMRLLLLVILPCVEYPVIGVLGPSIIPTLVSMLDHGQPVLEIPPSASAALSILHDLYTFGTSYRHGLMKNSGQHIA